MYKNIYIILIDLDDMKLYTLYSRCYHTFALNSLSPPPLLFIKYYYYVYIYYICNLLSFSYLCV